MKISINLHTQTCTHTHMHTSTHIHADAHTYQRRQWHPTPVLLPEKSHGQRSLVGCSPWGHEESDTTERLPFHFSLSCIGEGNGNPRQCSCLENPRDGGAWWTAGCGVAQSQTRLKRLSSSSSSSNPHVHAHMPAHAHTHTLSHTHTCTRASADVTASGTVALIPLLVKEGL